MMAIQQNFQAVITENDFQFVVISIHDRIPVLKDIINLVEDVRRHHLTKDVRIQYCSRIRNREDDKIAKRVHVYMYGLTFDFIYFIKF